MATPAEKLASSLEILQALQEQGIVAIRSSQLKRTQRERLVKNGFLREVMKGWYTPSRPDEAAGESTAWYASFWEFCAAYLEARFGGNWSLSPEQSLPSMPRTGTCQSNFWYEQNAAITNLFLAISYLSISIPIWMGMAVWGDF